jgi:hypothetical protein
MFDELRDRTPEVTLPDRNDPVEALLFERSHEPLGLRASIPSTCRRDGHPDPCLVEKTTGLATPFAIPITDQHLSFAKIQSGDIPGRELGLAHTVRSSRCGHVLGRPANVVGSLSRARVGS